MLKEEQGEWITKELYMKLLPAMGVNINFPRAYRHASKFFLGVVEETIYIVSYCMMYGTLDTLTGEVMKALTEQGQT